MGLTGLLAVLLPALLMVGAPELRSEEVNPKAGAFKSVVAEGVGAGEDRARARDDALADAQRRAVEQAVGLFIESDTLVVNATLVEDSIYRHSSGYVHSYKVVSDRYADGESRVKIDAKVAVGKIEEDLQDIAERIQVAGSPRIIVDIAGPQDAATGITEILVDNGFKVLDPEQLGRAQWTKSVRMMRDRKAREADIFLLQDAADIVITGTVKVKPLGKPSAGTGSDETVLDFYRSDATIDARAVRTDTAEVLCAGSRKARTPAFDQATATSEAVAAVTQTWVQANLAKLVKAAVDPARQYSLIITGCNQQDLDSINSQIIGLRFARASRLVAFDKRLAQLEVDFAGSASQLAGGMGAFEKPRVSVDSITARTIRASVK